MTSVAADLTRWQAKHEPASGSIVSSAEEIGEIIGTRLSLR